MVVLTRRIYFPSVSEMDKDKQIKSDQASHKVIEKRRRDRINTCLSELSQTIPTAFSKQTSGKLEKAEILEMTVDYLRAIQTTEAGIRLQNGDWFSSNIWSDFMHHYQTGYNDCIREILRYMTDVEGLNVNDERCVKLMSYLQTRFHPDSSVTGGIAYQQIKGLHSLDPSRTTYANISDIMLSNGPRTQLSRFKPYDMNLRSNNFHVGGTDIQTGKSNIDSTITPLQMPYTGLLRLVERNNLFASK